MADQPADRMPEDVAGAQPSEAGPLAAPSSEGGGRASWRSSVYASGFALAATGAWLVISPIPFSYAETLNPVICGILVIALAVLALGSGGARPIGMLAGVVGLWLVASPFVFSESTPETTNLAIFGGIVVVLALVALATREEAARVSRS